MVKDQPPSKAKKQRAQLNPITEIFKVKKKLNQFKTVENENLLKVMQRFDLDKPIQMQDKLDVMWAKTG